jgi:hypothetical protein
MDIRNLLVGAVISGDAEQVQQLVQGGADVNERGWGVRSCANIVRACVYACVFMFVRACVLACVCVLSNGPVDPYR